MRVCIGAAICAVVVLTVSQLVHGDTLLPFAVGGVYETPPFDGTPDAIESAPFIDRTNNSRESAILEYDLRGLPKGLVQSATLSGSIVPNNSVDTGTRIDNFDLYTGNGTIDLSDYTVPGISIGSASHPSGGRSDFNFNVAGVLHNLLAAGASYLGVRISPGSSVQAPDVVDDLPTLPKLTFSILPTGAKTVQKMPAVDAEADLTNGSFLVQDGQTGIAVQNVGFANIDKRAILEFNIGDIPIGANITGATLTLNLNSLSHNPTDYPQPKIYGYAGNGTAQPSDASQTGHLIGQPDPITQFAPVSIELDHEYIESLLGASNYVGVVITGGPNNEGFSFYSLEAASFATPPLLSLTYVPPVLSGDYSGNGTVGPEDYTVWKSNFGSTSQLAADGNHNGIVDAADYTVWRNHLGQSSGAASASAEVPEPPALLLVVVCAAFLPPRRLTRCDSLRTSRVLLD